MPEYAIDKSLFMIRPDTGMDITGPIASTDGWTDVSPGNKGRMRINGSASNTRLVPHGRDTMGRMVGGPRSGTMQCEVVRQNAADPGVAMFEDAWLSGSGRIHFLFQPDRLALTAADGTITPAASAANPQYVGSVQLNAWDLWGPGGFETAIMNATGDLDSDFGVHRA